MGDEFDQFFASGAHAHARAHARTDKHAPGEGLNGEELIIRTAYSITVQSKAKDSALTKSLKVEDIAIAVVGPNGKEEAGRVLGNANGIVTCMYAAQENGASKLRVKVRGEHIQGSPFSLMMAEQPHDPNYGRHDEAVAEQPYDPNYGLHDEAGPPNQMDMVISSDKDVLLKTFSAKEPDIVNEQPYDPNYGLQDEAGPPEQMAMVIPSDKDVLLNTLSVKEPDIGNVGIGWVSGCSPCRLFTWDPGLPGLPCLDLDSNVLVVDVAGSPLYVDSFGYPQNEEVDGVVMSGDLGDEVISVDLNQVGSEVHAIFFTLSINRFCCSECGCCPWPCTSFLAVPLISARYIYYGARYAEGDLVKQFSTRCFCCVGPCHSNLIIAALHRDKDSKSGWQFVPVRRSACPDGICGDVGCCLGAGSCWCPGSQSGKNLYGSLPHL